MNDSANHPGGQAKAGQRQTIGGILASALDMEDQISQGVYEEYLDRRKWPSQLDERIFEDIRQRLTTLVEDTKKHREILEALSREYDDQAK